ncbi:MAG: hypothetical protein WBY44_28730 [Bryobacteraceae bacterium]
MTGQPPDIELALQQEHARRQTPKPLPSLVATTRVFEQVTEDRYRIRIQELGIALEIDRLRRERGELNGELCVTCDLPGVRSSDGVLSIADFNMSSARARTDRAKLLAARANTRDTVDWTGIVEEFCQRVLQADRAGQPAVDLRTLERPSGSDDLLSVEGFRLPRRHASILFGDGGTAKSYMGLYYAGRAAESGIAVAYYDWELSGEDHRLRLERLFPDGMPRVLYVRCERPLVYEVDRLRRIVHDEKIEYSIYDSIAFACDGPPEAAEVAGRYFRAVRQVGGGSLHIAHISKGENADQKPFGSAFWHNGARSTWFVKQDEASMGSDTLRIGLFHRKSNLGKLLPPLGYSITFGEETTTFRRTDVAASPDLAEKMTVRQRMGCLLRRGSMTIEDLAAELDAKPETIERTAYRNKSSFVVLQGGKIGLVDRTFVDG